MPPREATQKKGGLAKRPAMRLVAQLSLSSDGKEAPCIRKSLEHVEAIEKSRAEIWASDRAGTSGTSVGTKHTRSSTKTQLLQEL